MVAWKKMFFLCFIGMFSCFGCLSSDGSSNKNKVPDFIEKKAQLIISDLAKQGFEVKRGYLKLYDKDDCRFSYEVMNTCYGNNPAAPYILPVLPFWEGEFVDESTKSAFGPTDEGYGASFRIDEKEAILIFGLLPPKASYFGMQSYLFTREGTFDTTSDQYLYFKNKAPEMLETFFSTVPKNPKRIQLLASMSNSINNVVIERQAGSAFEQERYFVVTPDRFMDAAVRGSLDRTPIGATDIFTEPVPPTARTGLGEQADDFITVMRYAMPDDTGKSGTPSDTWRKDLPLIVLRIRDTDQHRQPEPYPPVVLETRTADDEARLSADLAKLLVEVGRKWGYSFGDGPGSDALTSFLDMQGGAMNLVGPSCTEIGMNCLGDTQDTTYQMGSNLSLDHGEVYAIVGTLGTKTGNAKYVGLSVNYTLQKKGVENINDSQLKDTALEYAGVVDDADRFYVYYLTRDCTGLEDLTGGNRLSISESMVPPCPSLSGEPCGYAKLVQREYIRPGTQRGPDSKQVLLPRILGLKRP